MNFVKGEAVRLNPQLKKSFFKLANDTFGLDFEQWDEQGYWNDTYSPYAFEVGGEIIANVSTSSGTMILDGRQYKAVQIGTVMTNPKFQGKGLSRQLMDKVLEDHMSAQIIYLFANKTVLDFYPKFGFETRIQSTFTVDKKDIEAVHAEVKKVNLDDKPTRNLFYETTVFRKSVSQKMSMVNNENIVMFHALTQYWDCIYYVPKFQAFVILNETAEHAELVDVISKEQVDVQEILGCLPIQSEKIRLCFTPDNLQIPVIQNVLIEEGAMFVKNQKDIKYPNNVLYPYSGLA
ncbi:GNAT family N-acetyltransferase [Solibacillus sp. FSL W7-1464]|uniref:GNAT family N-acetyltransferase n=1 Tax=Solibacillus sp. FSL W7-1464 TaxID=2921706 RepID=UPI0030F57FB9